MALRDRATEAARRRYNRIAPMYDFMEGMMETRAAKRWRALLWSRVEGNKVLEVGVGTGKNFPHYPQDVEITAIDLSDRMLKRAREKAVKLGLNVQLQQMDAQRLEFPDNSFDTVAATCVFCSVPDPVRGLREIERVLKPGGKVVLMEHVLSSNRVLALMMNAVNPIVSRLIGPNINRRTVQNVALSGLIIEKVTDLGRGGIFKLIEARKKTP